MSTSTESSLWNACRDGTPCGPKGTVLRLSNEFASLVPKEVGDGYCYELGGQMDQRWVTVSMQRSRVRRGSVPRLQNRLDRPVRVAVPDLRSSAPSSHGGRSGRYRERPRTLTPARESTLRALAAEFGVGHEAVRAVRRVDNGAFYPPA